MPFKSEAQRRLFHVMADRGEISEEKVREWERKTKNKKKLPMHVKKEAAHYEFEGPTQVELRPKHPDVAPVDTAKTKPVPAKKTIGKQKAALAGQKAAMLAFGIF